MYRSIAVEDTIRVPPEELSGTPEENVKRALQRHIEGSIDKDIGVLVSVSEVHEVGEGTIEAGDAGVHYPVSYDAVVFQPELHEVVRGEVSDLTEFGAFVRIGPIEALCHVSQVMEDYVSFDEKNKQFAAKEADRTIAIGDEVIARITAVSLRKENHKINLTMRQPGLGKVAWLEQAREQEEEQEEEEGDA